MTGVTKTIASLVTDVDTVLSTGQGNGAISASRFRQLVEDLVASISSVQPRTAQTTSYTLALTDAGDCIDMNAAGPLTVTVPLNASVAFPVGTYIDVYQAGTGSVQVVGATGAVTLRTPATLFVARQYGKIRLEYRGSDEWEVSGAVQPLPFQVTARIDDFNKTLGASVHVAQATTGYTSAVPLIADMNYAGIRIFRDNLTTAGAAFDIYQAICTAGSGIRAIFIPGLSKTLVVANEIAATKGLLAALNTGAVMAIEQLNEPNLGGGGWIYNAETSNNGAVPGFRPVAKFSAAFYAALKADGVTANIPVYAVSLGGADPVDSGMQLLAIPVGYRHCTNLITATASTAIGNATLNFTSTTTSPVLTAGLVVYDDVNKYIPAGATIVSTTSTTIVLSATVTGAIAIGSTIRVGAQLVDTTIFADVENIHVYPMQSSESVFNNPLDMNPTTGGTTNMNDYALNINYVTTYGASASSGLSLAQAKALPKVITEAGLDTNSIQIVTTASTALGNGTLTFTNLGTIIPAVAGFVGSRLHDISNPAAISTGTTISATNSTTTITINPVAAALIPIGATIQLLPAAYGLTVPQVVQAKNLMTAWFLSWRTAYQAFILYEVYDQMVAEATAFGLFSAAGVPKTSGTYFHNLTTVLQDPGVAKSTFSPNALQCLVSGLPATSGQAAYFQRSDGVYVIAIWNEISNWNDALSPPAAVTITPSTVGISFAKEGIINWYDPTIGTASQGTTTNNNISLTLTDYPLIVTFV